MSHGRILGILAVVVAVAGPGRAGSGAPGGLSEHAALPLPANVNGDEVMVQTFRAELEGGVIVAGCGVRSGGPPEATGTITIAGIPPGATIVKAILNWAIMGGTQPTPDATFHLSTAPPAMVTGTLLGADGDPCWSLGWEFVFSADVTAAVPGDGAYNFKIPDSGSLTTAPSAEGATLIVVYCAPGLPRTDIVIYEGWETQISGDTIQTVTGFDAAATITFARATFVVDDGQSAGGVAYVNGGPVIGPVFDGDEGQCASPTMQFYDVDTVDVSALVAPLDTSLVARVESTGDCLNWNVFVLEIASDTIAPPPACNSCPSIPAASAGAGQAICAGASATLDGTASSGCSSGTFEYRWSEGPLVLCDWSPTPTCLVTPAATSNYQLEVRCADAPSCVDADSTTVDVNALPTPALEPLAGICAGSSITLDASGSTLPSCGGVLEYQFRDSSGILQPWSASSSYGPFAPATGGSYSVEVRCAAAPSCVASASQPLEVFPVPSAVLAPPGVLCAGAAVTLDGSSSAGNGCPVALEYQFRDGAGILQAWSAAAQHGPFVPAASGSYTVEVRCTALPGCEASASQPLTRVEPPVAALASLGTVCAGTTVTLDASGSSGPSCPVALEYQFSSGATVLQAWSASASHGPVSPAATTSYTVEVRCPAAVGCEQATSATATVIPVPVAAAGSDVDVCLDDAVTLSGASSSAAACPGGPLYEWRSGAAVVRPASPVPSWSPPTTTPGTTTYTLVVSCASLASCADPDDVLVRVRNCPMAVRFVTVAASLDPTTRRATLRWLTSLEAGTLGFSIERAEGAGSAFADTGLVVEAVGPGHPYRVEDPVAIGSGGAWYRVVEHTAAGRGDVSPGFPATTAGESGAASGRRRAGAARRGR